MPREVSLDEEEHKMGQRMKGREIREDEGKEVASGAN
jgi:hypothetical protein